MPLRSNLHVDQLLTNMSVRYTNNQFVADQLFPKVPVKKTTDLFRVYDRNFKLPETNRASKGKSREFSFEVSTSSYALEWHALKDYIGDREAENYDLASLKADATIELTEKIMLRKEKSVADLMTSTSWSQVSSLTAAQQFDNTTTANPITLVDSATTVILENSGMMANVMLIPWRVLIACKNNAQVIERIKYTSADITPNMIAGLFDKEKLLVPKAVLDSAAPGIAASVAALFSDNCLVAYSAPSPGPRQVSAGYIFQNERSLVKTWRDEEREAEAVEVNVEYQAKVVASLAGYLLKDCIA